MARDDAEEDAVLGVAVSTRNYRALLAHSGVAAVRNSNSHSKNNDDGYNENTVVGLPVATGNYMALLNPTVRGEDGRRVSAYDRRSVAANERRSSVAEGIVVDERRSSVAEGMAVEERRSSVADGIALDSGNFQSYRTMATNQREDANGEEDERDAVLGLPISTGNYKAMYRQDGSTSVRQRGYSDLASRPPRDRGRSSVSSRNSAPEYGVAGRNSIGGSSHGGPARSTESCFDTRRMTGAIVPHKAWLYLQSPTMKTWKRYYAVLSGIDFRYSSEPGRASKGFGMIQSVRRWDAKPCGLLFVYSSGAEVPAYCVTERERDDWIDAVSKSLDRLQNSSGHSKTTYTLATDQHEGYLFKQDKNKSWILCFFTLRKDGYMQCRDDAGSPVDTRSSGFVRSVSFADVHENALVIQLESGNAVFVYTETYDDRMLWFSAMTAASTANGKTPVAPKTVKSSYVQTALPNHSGWLMKQTGLFKSWKRLYFTLHGLELGFARDVNLPLEECSKIHSAKDWDGRQHGLEIRFGSGQVWRVCAESYEMAKHWRTVIAEVTRHSDRYNIRRYLASRHRKKMRPVFGGWLTLHDNNTKIRRFYVMDGNMLGVADDVDNLLQPIGSVVDIGATRDTANGMVIGLADGKRLKVSGDSVESARAWYECLSSTI